MAAFAEKLKDAGVDIDAALLHALAVERLRASGIDVGRAIGPFVSQIRGTGRLMAALISYAATRDAAHSYLRKIAADMRGGLKESLKGVGAVRCWDESRGLNGRAEDNAMRIQSAGRRGIATMMRAA